MFFAADLNVLHMILRTLTSLQRFDLIIKINLTMLTFFVNRFKMYIKYILVRDCARNWISSKGVLWKLYHVDFFMVFLSLKIDNFAPWIFENNSRICLYSWDEQKKCPTFGILNVALQRDRSLKRSELKEIGA